VLLTCAQGVYSSVLSLLARQHPLSQQQAAIAAAVLRCSVGCIYDSCPVDFTSAAVSRSELHTRNIATDCAQQTGLSYSSARHPNYQLCLAPSITQRLQGPVHFQLAHTPAGTFNVMLLASSSSSSSMLEHPWRQDHLSAAGGGRGL
jgi:hypothetical protein